MMKTDESGFRVDPDLVRKSNVWNVAITTVDAQKIRKSVRDVANRHGVAMGEVVRQMILYCLDRGLCEKGGDSDS